MYNEVKINMLDNDCDCEYVLSEDGTAITPFVYIRMYIGVGLENIEIRAKSNNQEDYWALPEISGGYVDGWYLTRLSYSDFAKTGSENYEIGVQAFANGEQIGTKTLFFFHSGLQSSGDWVVTKQHGVIRDAYEVMQGSSSSGGGGGGSGGGGTTYTAGNGIEISDSDEIKAKIDSSTIQFNSNGQMYVPTAPLSLENAIVIQEADAKYLLHEYTTVDYIAGNKIVYAGPGNQIIVDGMVVFKLGGIAPNGIALPSDYNTKNYSLDSMSELSTEVPNPPFYSTVSLPKNGKWYSSSKYYVNKFELLLTEASTYTDTYDGYSYEPDGRRQHEYSFTNYYGFGGYGHFYLWENIYPPGSTVAEETWEFGCACCTGFKLYRDSDYSGGKIHITIVRTASRAWYFPFVSEAEYNAAVGLTYEPNTLTQVNETVTEV